VSPDEIRRAVRALPLPARRALVSTLDADLELIDRVTEQTAWLSFRLRGALSNRGWRKRR
jgi:hypothetical protein